MVESWGIRQSPPGVPEVPWPGVPEEPFLACWSWSVALLVCPRFLGLGFLACWSWSVAPLVCPRLPTGSPSLGPSGAALGPSIFISYCIVAGLLPSMGHRLWPLTF